MQFTIHDRLLEARKKLGLTQKDIAEKLAVRQSYYSDVENGRRTLTNKFMEKLISTFPISKDWLYTGKGIILTTDTTTEGLVQDTSRITVNQPVELFYTSELGLVLLDKLIDGTIQQLVFYCVDLLGRIQFAEHKYIDTKSIIKYAENLREYALEIRQARYMAEGGYKPDRVEEKIKLLNSLNEKVTECLDLLWSIGQKGHWEWDKLTHSDKQE